MGVSIQSSGKTRDVPQCVWMQAGAVPKRECRLSYRCHECRFDRMLRRAVKENYRRRDRGEPLLGKRGRLVFWKDRLRERPPWKRPCIHHLKGRIDFRVCTHDYRCADCDFDQFFQDQFAVHAVMRPVNLLSVRGVDIPQGIYLHPGHLWARIEEDGGVRVGLDDFARRVLGPPDAVDTPLMGKPVMQHEPVIRVSRKGAAAAFSAPVSGVVTDINPALQEGELIVHGDPYASGWILRLHSDTLRQELPALLIGGESRDFLSGEVDRLFQMIEETSPLAADGGSLGDDIFGNLPEIGWERLNREFFNKTGR